jgi:hypothetical protein
MKQYPEEIIREAETLYIKRKFGAVRIHRELLKQHQELAELQRTTIDRWILKGKWAVRRREVSEETNRKLVNSMAEENIKEMRMIDGSIAMILADIQGRKVRASYHELVELIKLRMTKRGESTENIAVGEVDLKKIYNETVKRNHQVAGAGDKG